MVTCSLCCEPAGMTMVSTNNGLGGLQEPVQQLRTEYKQIINRLPEVLSTEQAEEVLHCLLTLSTVQRMHMQPQQAVCCHKVPDAMQLLSMCGLACRCFKNTVELLSTTLPL